MVLEWGSGRTCKGKGDSRIIEGKIGEEVFEREKKKQYAGKRLRALNTLK